MFNCIMGSPIIVADDATAATADAAADPRQVRRCSSSAATTTPQRAQLSWGLAPISARDQQGSPKLIYIIYIYINARSILVKLRKRYNGSVALRSVERLSLLKDIQDSSKPHKSAII
jgi:hypothetical protein